MYHVRHRFVSKSARFPSGNNLHFGIFMFLSKHTHTRTQSHTSAKITTRTNRVNHRITSLLDTL